MARGVHGGCSGFEGGRLSVKQTDRLNDSRPQSPYADDGTPVKEVPVVTLLKRHEVQVLLHAGLEQARVSEVADVAVRTVQRIAQESAVEHIDDEAERAHRRIGRPSIAEPFRQFVKDLLGEQPGVMSVEILRRAKLKGYRGCKSAMYELVREIRPREVRLGMRFEGLPGEFSQHDFGQIKILFLDGTEKIIHFFASRLKWSRWVEVTLVGDEGAETLIRTLAEHFVAFGGVPLCAVFDRPKTVALSWGKDGVVKEWNPTFAFAALEIGFTAEVCWPYQPRQKGSVESLVKWVKGSFFKQRRFHDLEDLRQQLSEWRTEVNEQRPCRATAAIPASRMGEERLRLRPLRCPPEQLALRVPIHVGVTAEVSHEGRGYSMPPEAAGLPGTLYLYRDKVRIVAGRFEATHPRCVPGGRVSRLPEHRAAHLAALSGKRGKRYLKRQQLFEVGEAAVEFLTEIVHRRPLGWIAEVELLHRMLQSTGTEPMERAFRAAVQSQSYSVDFIAQCLGCSPIPLDLAITAEEAVS